MWTGGTIALRGLPVLLIQKLLLLLLGCCLLLIVVSQIEAVRAFLTIVQLHASAFLADKMANGRRVVLIGFQTVVAHAEHLAGEGLSHDGLTALSCRLRQDACVRHVASPYRLTHSMGRVWFLD